MTTSFTVFEAEGFDWLIDPITFDSAAGATTMVGATVAVAAINAATEVKVAGSAAVVDATSIRATFAGWALPAGRYSVQVEATPSGYAKQIIADCALTVKKSATVAP